MSSITEDSLSFRECYEAISSLTISMFPDEIDQKDNEKVQEMCRICDTVPVDHKSDVFVCIPIATSSSPLWFVSWWDSDNVGVALVKDNPKDSIPTIHTMTYCSSILNLRAIHSAAMRGNRRNIEHTMNDYADVLVV